jgi:hypothetical protein
MGMVEMLLRMQRESRGWGGANELGFREGCYLQR